MLAERAVLPNEIDEFTEAAEKKPGKGSPKPRIKRKWKHRNKFMKYSFLLMLYAGLLVALQLQGSMLSYEITSLKKDISDLQTDNYRIDYQIQQLSSLDRIEAVATQELHMVKPEWNQAYVVAKVAAPVSQADDSLLNETIIPEPEKPLAKFYNFFQSLWQP